MGIFSEAGHNIGVFIITTIGIIVFFIVLALVVGKFAIPFILAKLSDIVNIRLF